MPARRTTRLWTTLTVFLAALWIPGPAAQAGGSPENVLLVIDPSDATSVYLGNYYRHARNIPGTNVLYMNPNAVSFQAFADFRIDPLFAALAAAGIDDHIDYIVVAPGPTTSFYIYAPNLVSDTCSPVTRFSMSSAFTLAFIADEVLGTTLPSSTSNRYYSSTNSAQAFDSSTAWYFGSPSTSPAARRYFIGAMLGYTGTRGNTPAELVAMIDRSVAADGTRPTGTFYFMNNTADPARNVRASQYSTVRTALIGAGAQAQIINGTLPVGNHDGLGIMTGAASLGVLTADYSLYDGAFCDHLTSWAATFDIASQTKLSEWIAKGASGSWGAVEEPCNYTGKFPHARLHLYYYQGSSLGEAAFRSAQFTPFQMLLYGDPLTRPFAYLPTVTVNNPPPDPASGFVFLSAGATTAKPGAAIARLELLIDGQYQSTVTPGQSFLIDTTQLADGWHDLRVLAYDNTLVASVGRWTDALNVDNHGRSVALAANPLTGDLATQFDLTVTTTGDNVREVRIMQNNRVVAAAPGAAAVLPVHGAALGAGPVTVQAEAFFCDGSRVRSAPVTLDVAFDVGTPSGALPVAYNYTKVIRSDDVNIVELPATCDDGSAAMTWQIVAPPATATYPAWQSGPYRFLYPVGTPTGTDTLTFRATSAAGSSNTATVTLVYEAWPVFGDLTCDGFVTAADFAAFEPCLAGPDVMTPPPGCDPDTFARADFDGDGDVDAADYAALQTAP